MQTSSDLPTRSASSGFLRLVDFRAFRGSLRKAAAWLVLPTILVGGLAIAGGSSKPQLYEATVRVDLGPANAAGSAQSGRGELQLVRALARRVMGDLPLGGEPEFQRNNLFDLSKLAARLGVSSAYGSRKDEALLVNALSDRLTLRPSDNGRALWVSFLSENPQTAERVAERVAQSYVDLRREAARARMQDAVSALSADIGAVREKIAAAREAADPEQRATLGELQRSVDALERQRVVLDHVEPDARLTGRARAEPVDKHAEQLTTAFYAASAAGLAGALACFVALFASVRPMPRHPQSNTLPRSLGEAPAYEALRELGAVVMRGETSRRHEAIEAGDARLVEQLAAQLAARSLDGRGLRILVATSAAKESGSVCVDLARALASFGRRAVIVETGGRSSSFSVQGEGLSELLVSTASFADVIHRDPRSRVHFISAGQAPPPSGKVLAERLAVVIDALALTYDFVLLAGPAADESAPLARVADAAILVTADSPTSARTLAAYDALVTQGIADIVVLLAAVRGEGVRLAA